MARWNCELVTLLEQRGYDVAIATTSTSDHSCQEFFYRATPDIFHLPNLFDKVQWLTFIRYILASRQIDAVMISGSEIAYSFLPLIRSEFPQLALIDYTCAGNSISQTNGNFPLSQQLSQSLDCRIVASYRQANEYASLNSTTHSHTKVCHTHADVEVALAEAITARQTFVPIETNVEVEHETLLLLEYLQEPVCEHQPEVFKTETAAEPTVRQLLKLLLKKLVKG